MEGREKDASAQKPVVHRLVLLGVSGFAIVASRAHGAKRMRRPRSGGAVPRTPSPADSPATAIHDPSRIDILRAVAPGERYITVPYVRPAKQRALPSILALNEALHSVPPRIALES